MDIFLEYSVFDVLNILIYEIFMVILLEYSIFGALNILIYEIFMDTLFRIIIFGAPKKEERTRFNTIELSFNSPRKNIIFLN